jgi:hypothetical protein
MDAFAIQRCLQEDICAALTGNLSCFPPLMRPTCCFRCMWRETQRNRVQDIDVCLSALASPCITFEGLIQRIPFLVTRPNEVVPSLDIFLTVSKGLIFRLTTPFLLLGQHLPDGGNLTLRKATSPELHESAGLCLYMS